MATDKKAPAAADKADKGAPAPKKSGKLKIIIAAAVVVLAGGGVGAWLLLKPAKPAAGAHPEPAKTEPRAVPQYFKFDPAFVVNFGGEGNSRFLQVTVEAMSRDPTVVEAVKANEPAIRNDLVLLFSGQTYDALITNDGKEKLRQATLDAIRKTIAAEGAKPEALEGVYFTSFVIQ
jgi:flagellar FliL protein